MTDEEAREGGWTRIKGVTLGAEFAHATYTTGDEYEVFEDASGTVMIESDLYGWCDMRSGKEIHKVHLYTVAVCQEGSYGWQACGWECVKWSELRRVSRVLIGLADEIEEKTRKVEAAE